MKLNVCVLGAGRMGSSIARTFLDRGHPTWVWNRTPAKCAPLAALGAKVAASVEDGVQATDVVIINVLDCAASEALLRGPESDFASLSPLFRNGGLPHTAAERANA